MEWWIQTRGETVDYRFLGEQGEPPRWWAPYLRLAVPEDPMLVVQIEASGWWLYATAMPSGRFDGASRPIRNSLVVRGGQEEGELLARLVLGYFSGSVSDVLRAHAGGDARPQVEAWLAATAIPSESRRKLEDALLPVGEAVAAERRSGTWSGSTTSATAQRALAATARYAAEERVDCVAAQLNLMSEVSEALALARVRAAQVRVFLLEGGSDGLVMEGPNPPQAGPSPKTEAGTSGTEEQRQTLARILWFLLLKATGWLFVGSDSSRRG